MENEIGLVWKRFFKLYKENSDTLVNFQVDRNVSYEVHIEPEEYKESKKYYIFVGVEVTEIKEVPLGMFALVLPNTQYATFTFKGKENMTAGDAIWSTWMPKSHYVESYPYMIQAYDHRRFKEMHDENSEIDWMAPVEKR